MAKGTRVDMSGIISGLAKPKISSAAISSAARAMGVAMGQSVRDEAKERAPVLQPGNEGTDSQNPGVLRDAIYLAYDDRRAVLNPSSYRYTVSWNSKKAPHGHLLEFGYWQPYLVQRNAQGLWTTPIPNRTAKGTQRGIPHPEGGFAVQAFPFLGPAFDAKYPSLASTAFAAGTKKFNEVMK